MYEKMSYRIVIKYDDIEIFFPFSIHIGKGNRVVFFFCDRYTQVYLL